MKIRVYIKDPDGVGDAIRDAINAQFDEQKIYDKEEREVLSEIRKEKLGEKLSKWIDCGENIILEFDLDTMAATVMTRHE